ncbi:MAG TPA: amidohydrolase family protein [Candidatus Acidoferrum sp.]|nr:amidohydrolase family protein [Candidatus Acidoferrum sp.]
MQWIAKVALLIALGLAGTMVANTGDESQVLAVTHAAVIDPATGSLRVDQTVVIADGRIRQVVLSANYHAEKGARIIDARGKYLIPGLWDMHVHIAGISADPAWSKNVNLPLLIAEGITGVRDMGGDLSVLRSWNHDIETGKLLGPRIFAGGPMLVPSGKKTPEQWPVNSSDEARAAVRELKQQGADFIKMISVPSREIFFAIAEEANKEKIPFVGHVPAAVTASEASGAGMRSIEHIVYSNLALDCSAKEKELREALLEARKKRDQSAPGRILAEAVSTYSAEKAAALWATFRKNGTWVAPTLAAIEVQTPQTATPEEQASDPRLEFVPASLQKEWDPRDPKNRSSEEDQKWWAAQFANDERLTRDMHKAGVSLLAGSDSLDRFVFPGFALHRELSLLNQHGLTPLEALRAATSDAAKFLGHEGEFGVIASGAHADLVLLNENPLDKISNTTSISAVIREGVYLDRAALDQLLSQAKTAAKAASTK